MRVLETNKGVRVETDLTDDEAIAGLKQMPDHSFAQSLLSKLRQYGSLTTSQLAWAHKLVIDRRNPPLETVVPLGDFAQIGRLFQTAATKLKHPKIRFNFEDQPIHLALASMRSRHPGEVYVTNGADYEARKYYGRIDKEGAFHPTGSCPDTVTAFLKIFAQRPAEIAAGYGKSEGNCCFCGLPLTDERSIAVGYGPVCSKNFGMPYPTLHEVREMQAVQATQDPQTYVG